MSGGLERCWSVRRQRHGWHPPRLDVDRPRPCRPRPCRPPPDLALSCPPPLCPLPLSPSPRRARASSLPALDVRRPPERVRLLPPAPRGVAPRPSPFVAVPIHA